MKNTCVFHYLSSLHICNSTCFRTFTVKQSLLLLIFIWKDTFSIVESRGSEHDYQREICLLHNNSTKRRILMFFIIFFSLTGTGSEEFKLKGGKFDLSSDSKNWIRFSSTLWLSNTKCVESLWVWHNEIWAIAFPATFQSQIFSWDSVKSF